MDEGRAGYLRPLPLVATAALPTEAAFGDAECAAQLSPQAPHRQDAFDAAQFLMDYLKTRAPFWKKETAPDGSGVWVDARDGDDSALERWEG